MYIFAFVQPIKNQLHACDYLQKHTSVKERPHKTLKKKHTVLKSDHTKWERGNTPI